MADIDEFTRFLRGCAARSGQLLNYSELANDLDISVPTAKRWFSVLETSFQVVRLQPFHSNRTKRLVKTPKLYFLDTGFCSYLAGWTSVEALMNGAMAGPILETYIHSEILKSWWSSIRDPALFFCRDRDGREIDFVFEQDGQLWPLEIKKSARVRPDWIKSFSLLDRLGDRGRGAVACFAEEPIPIDSMNMAVPVQCIG